MKFDVLMIDPPKLEGMVSEERTVTNRTPQHVAELVARCMGHTIEQWEEGWQRHGYNHRREGTEYVREDDLQRDVIEINSLEDLVALVWKYGSVELAAYEAWNDGVLAIQVGRDKAPCRTAGAPTATINLVAAPERSKP